MVARYHVHADPSRGARFHRSFDRRARGVDEGREAHQREAARGEVRGFCVGVEDKTRLAVLGPWQGQVGEREDPLTLLTKLRVEALKLLQHLWRHLNNLAALVRTRAHPQHPLRRPLDEHHDRLGLVLQFVHRQHPLVGRVEGYAAPPRVRFAVLRHVLQRLNELD